MSPALLRLDRGKIVAALIVRFWLAIAATSSAEGVFVKQWQTGDGLPHSSVNSIIQTRDGYLWIGTYVGLVRFDGVKFDYISPDVLPDLETGRISHLFQDKDGTLWIGLESGRLFSWKDGVAKVYLKGGDESAVLAMAQDNEGIIWLEKAGQLGRVATNGIKYVAQTSSSDDKSKHGLAVDSTGNLWVGTSDGIRIWRNGKLEIPEGLASLTEQPVEAFSRGHDGSIWLYQRGRVWKIRSGEQPVSFDGPTNITSWVTDILEDQNQKIWLSEIEGALFYSQSSNTWQRVSDENGLLGRSQTLCEDREGNIWRGSFGGGLARIRAQPFSVFQSPKKTLNQYALSVSADTNGNVWAILNDYTVAKITAGATPEVLIENNVGHPPFRTIIAMRNGAVYVGSGSGYLYRRQDNGRFMAFKADAKAAYVSALYEDAQSNLWVGFSQGAGIGFMPQGDPGQWREFTNTPLHDVRTIVQAADGAMWFGTYYAGVWRLKDGQWSNFRIKDGLPSDYIRCQHADADGTVWFGTLRGMCRWRDGKFTSIVSRNGLWNDSISSLMDDARGNFWVGSFGGILRVAKSDLNDFCDGKINFFQCVGYNRNDGLPSQECTGGFQPSAAKTPDGRLWIPTSDGLLSFLPEAIPDNKLPPPVILEEVLVENVASQLRHPNADSTIKIAPGKHNLEFGFAALSYTDPGKVRFRHKLDGLDHDWSAPDDRRTVNYNYLPPGKYTFHVIGCNNAGVWNEVGDSIRLSILPFYWQTLWFKTAGIILVVVTAAGIIRGIERKKARIRLETLKQRHVLERERARIATDIHDNLGASLTRIVFLNERLESASREPAEVQRWSRQVKLSAQASIQSLDEIVWAIDPAHDTLESFSNYLYTFVQEYLTLAGVRCLLDIPTVVPAIELRSEVRHNLLLAIREAVHNIVVHAQASEVNISLRLQMETMEIVIADNGHGFDMTQAASDGHGLPNLSKRLQTIGGSMNISSSPSLGTKITFLIPIKSCSEREQNSQDKPGGYES